MDWKTAQSSADDLLAEGLYALLSAPNSKTYLQGAGNYLISLAGRPMYVGEARDCRKRLAQQIDERRSTFYKNYCELTPNPIHPINSFTIQAIPVVFGRKEVEDFGIVNLPTQLNRFQLGKRAIQPKANSTDRWVPLQEMHANLLNQGAALCEEIDFRPWSDATAPDSSGLYLIRSPQSEIIYVGESSNIKARFLTHGTRTYFSAVRRNLGVDILGFHLQTIKGKKRFFSDDEDRLVTDYISKCFIGFFRVNIGRYELEEHLIHKYRPFLNRKAMPKG
jgi:predicted GIY-YIG superfamily endonuclease